MDTERNIFAPNPPEKQSGTIGEPVSELSKLSGGAASASEGIKSASGYVDPATARATAGAEPGPGNPTGTAPGSPAASAEPVKRGRGRPPGSGKSAASKAQEAGNLEGGGNPKAVNINGIDKILFNIHLFLGATIAPELILDEKEAKELSNAIKGVNEQYKLTLDPKQAAWIDLATCCGIIYGPRGLAIYLRKSSAPKPMPQRQAPQQPAQQSAPMPNVNGFDPTKIVLQ